MTMHTLTAIESEEQRPSAVSRAAVYRLLSLDIAVSEAEYRYLAAAAQKPHGAWYTDAEKDVIGKLWRFYGAACQWRL